MKSVIIFLSILLAILILIPLLGSYIGITTRDKFPYTLRPVIEIRITRLTHDNYTDYLRSRYSIHSIDFNELREWIARKLDEGANLTVLEIYVHIENRERSRAVDLYRGGCLGYLRIIQVSEGELAPEPRFCTLPLIISAIPNGGRVSDYFVLFATIPMKARLEFSTVGMSTYCMDDECYNIRLTLDLMVLSVRMGRPYNVIVRSIEYIPARKP